MKHSNNFYQIDMIAASSGRHVAATKRRVRWRFGIANPDALKSGQSGVNCRGREYEVTFVWSLTSGKRLVLADQKEVHYSQGRRTEGKFTTSWEMRGGHTITIIAHAAPPLKSKPGWKQFDLRINGCSFDSLSRIYELGTSARDSRSVVPHGHYAQAGYSNYSVDRNAEREWAHNLHKQESLRDMNHNHGDQQAISSERRASAMNRDAVGQTDVPNFAVDNSVRVDFMSDSVLPAANQDFISAQPSLLEQQQATQSAPQLNAPYDQFQPHDEFNPNQPPTYEAIWASILDQYDDTPAAPETPAVVNSPAPVEAQQPYDAPQTPEPKVTINKQIQFEEERVELFGNSSPAGVDEVNSAFSNLVNLDDLTSPAEAKKKKLTMMNEEKAKKNRTGALPPKAAGWNLGPSPTLSELKAIQTTPSAETKEIMSPHKQATGSAPAAGALVVYGSNQEMGYKNYGPPPLQKTQGFGVGATVYTQQSPYAQQSQNNGYNYNTYHSYQVQA